MNQCHLVGDAIAEHYGLQNRTELEHSLQRVKLIQVFQEVLGHKVQAPSGSLWKSTRYLRKFFAFNINTQFSSSSLLLPPLLVKPEHLNFEETSNLKESGLVTKTLTSWLSFSSVLVLEAGSCCTCFIYSIYSTQHLSPTLKQFGLVTF